MPAPGRPAGTPTLPGCGWSGRGSFADPGQPETWNNLQTGVYDRGRFSVKRENGAHHFQGHEGVYTIDTLEILRGSLPRRAHALVIEWAGAHRVELRADWDRARESVRLEPIEPLE